MAALTWTKVVLQSDPSYVETVPIAINNRYQILGYSVDASGTQHQFVQRLSQQRRYLGPDFIATALNDDGLLAGSYKGVPAFWDSDRRVTVIPGVVRGSAVDISETGWIIGNGQLADGPPRSFIWRSGWPQVRILAASDAASTPVSVVSVNNSGYSVGRVGSRGGVFSPTGVFTPIPLPDLVLAVQPAEISDAGQVVGYASVFHPFGGHSGFSWSANGPMTVMVPNHFLLQFYVTDVDKQGRVYGTVRADFVFYSPGVWSGGVLLPVPFGASYTQVTDVNDCGVIVGWDQWPHSPAPRIPMMWTTEC